MGEVNSRHWFEMCDCEKCGKVTQHKCRKVNDRCARLRNKIMKTCTHCGRTYVIDS